jgi:hypothetical protein
MPSIFDCCIIGMGVGGIFASHRIATKHRGLKLLCIEAGRPSGKRRLQMMGFGGTFPSGDGKLFLSDLPIVANLVGLQKTKSAHNVFKQILNQISKFQIIKDRMPISSMEKRLSKLEYQISLNDYIQMFPKEIHSLSKYIANIIEQDKNITCSFDNEVLHITKQKNTFILNTEEGEFRSKKIILAVGRSGWRWAQEVFTKFELIENNDLARFGIRIETNSHILKDFNRSCCTMMKSGLELGPLSWGGTVIPEDHWDLAVSTFRSNEDRWKTDKVSFNLIGERPYPNKGFEQTDRLGKLTFIIANDRIIKERVSMIINGRSKLSIMKEYDWLKPVLLELAEAIPEILTKSHYHAPTITAMASPITLDNNLESKVPSMYVIGESAGIRGILGAAVSGILVGDFVTKRG